jgi:hypothetical protein
MRLVANVTIQVKGGGVTITRRLKNLVTDVGLAHIAGLLNGLQTTAAKYIAVGEGDSPVDAGDIELESEAAHSGLDRKLGTTSLTTTNVTDDTAVITAIFDVTNDVEVTEFGLFSALSGGVLVARVVSAPISITTGQTLTMTWSYSIEEA